MKKYLPLFILLGTGIITIWFIYMAIVLSISKGLPESGQFGDLFGGLNALFSGFAFAGVIIAIFLQSRELELQRKELLATREELKGQKEQMEAQNETLNIQRFENTFFHLLRLHREIVDNSVISNFGGKKSFQYYFDILKSELSRQKNINNNEREALNRVLPNFFRDYQTYTSDYIKTTIKVLQFISGGNLKDPYLYGQILRTQLSTYEVIFLFYYCLSLEGRDKLKPLAIKFDFFNELPVEKLIDQSHASLL